MIAGVTFVGGAFSRGTMFSMSKDGSRYALLRSFQGGDSDGSHPSSGLIEKRDGRFYGAASRGGDTDSGAIFAIDPDGSDYRVIWEFDAIANGSVPRGRLSEGPDGSLYGTTYQGGRHGRGTVFAIRRDGTDFRVLWHFGGTHPLAGLTIGNDSALYGVTEGGGAKMLGAIYRLDPVASTLQIQPQGEQALVRWQVTSTEDVLEQTFDLSPPVLWSPVNSPSVTNAGLYETSVPLPTNTFLRVRRSWR